MGMCTEMREERKGRQRGGNGIGMEARRKGEGEKSVKHRARKVATPSLKTANSGSSLSATQVHDSFCLETGFDVRRLTPC